MATLRARLVEIPLLVMPLLVLTASTASAAASPPWKEIGGSASGNGLSQAPAPRSVLGVSVALGPDGRLVVAYSLLPDSAHSPGVIVVKRWTGSAWETLSGADGIGQGISPQIAIATSGTIYVAWLQQDGGGYQVALKRRTAPNGVWEGIEGSDGPRGLTDVDDGAIEFSLAVDGGDNPLVAFGAFARTGIQAPAEGILDGSPQVYVKRHQPATGWQYLGTDPLTGGGASSARSFPAGSSPAYTSHRAYSPSLTVDAAGVPVVAFVYATGGATNTEILVTAWDGSGWNAVGPPVPQADDGGAARGGLGGISATAALSRNPSLAAGVAEELWVAWIEEIGPFERDVFVRRWTGERWEELAGSASGAGISTPGLNDGPRVVVQAQGADSEAIVIWQSKTFVGSQIFAKSAASRAEAFQPAGLNAAQGDGISAAAVGALYPTAAASSTGGPVVVWHDLREPTFRSQAFLRQLSERQLDVHVRGSGRVVSTPSGVDCPDRADCSHLYPIGQVVTLQAIAGPDTLLERWTGACGGAGPCAVTMSTARTVNASFVSAATLTVAKSGTGAAFGSVHGPRIACGEDCQEKYSAGTTVTLTIGLPAGTLFSGWGGDCVPRGRNSSCTLVMNGNHSVTAAFTQRVHRLTLAVTKPAGTAGRGGLGSVTTTAGDASLGTCGAGGAGTCASDLDYGTRVVLRAVAEDGNRFITWQGPYCGGRTNATCELKMTGNVAITALFRAVTAIEIFKTGNGHGTVSGPGITCGADCSGEAFTNTSATVTFTPATGTNFIQWEGGACDGVKTTSCTFRPTNDVAITAHAELRRQRLIVTPRPNGSVIGTSGLSIACGTECTATADYGTVVGLRVVADPGFVFTRWAGSAPCSGGAAATNASCVFALQANVTATPSFRAATTVTVVKNGDGRGTVTAAGTLSVPGASCGPSCASSTFQAFDGRPVTLRATASVGSTFVGFTGACGANASPCTFVPSDSAQNVNAIFVLQPRTVIVDVRGDGTVTGASTAAGAVSCAAIGCPIVGMYGQELVLTAAPGSVNRLIAWTGCTSANGSVCRVLLTNAKPAPVKVTTTFSFSLTVARLGDGVGVVTGPGINCGTDCVETYAPGASVSLSQRPGAGSGFGGWTGDCSVLANGTCLVTMTANRQVSTTFGRPRTLTVVKTGIGDGRVNSDPLGIDCGPVCTKVFPYRTLVFLAADPAAGSIVDPISVPCEVLEDGAFCTIEMTADTTIEVPFNPPGRVQVQFYGGRDQGRVVSEDGRIDCGAGHDACVARYPLHTVVRLTATSEAEGWIFGGWGGVCANATNRSCTLTVTGRQDVALTFIRGNAVTIDFLGAGAGTVTAQLDYAGVPCVSPGSCTRFIIPGTVVRLAPVVSSGVFGEWSGDCAGTARNASCELYVPYFGNRSVTVSFLADPVAVQVAGSSDVSIGDGGGITCSEPCERVFERGSAVTFDGLARPGRVFTWTGDCASFGNASCILAVTEPRTVGTDVVIDGYELTVFFDASYYPFFDVRVQVGDFGVCVESCTVVVPVGQEVTITVTSVEGAINFFQEFFGDCTGTEPVCIVLMDRDRFVDVVLVCDSYHYYCGCCELASLEPPIPSRMATGRPAAGRPRAAPRALRPSSRG